MKMFKAAISALLGSFLLMLAIQAHAAFTVTWDHNAPRPDAYAVYAREDGAAYDYNAPIWEGPENQQHIVDLLPPLPAINPAEALTATFDKASGNITLGWTQPAPLVNDQLYYLVVRAQIGTRGQSDFMDSADSEEVSITQSNGNIATKWEIYYSLTAGGPYTKLDETTSEGGLTAPFTAVPVNTRADVYFTVVTFGEENTYSPNSAEVMVTIDRRTVPTPPTGVTAVEVTVPVQ